LALLVIFALVVGLVTIPLFTGASKTTSIASTSVMSTTTNISTVDGLFIPGVAIANIDSSGNTSLDLVLALNATTIKQGQDIPNLVEVVNTLPRENNVTVENNFAVRPYFGKCDPGDSTPIDVEMYSGYYDKSNITGASPLPYLRSCPAMFPNSLVTEEYYLFQPNSTNSTLYALTETGTPANSGPMSLRFVNGTSVYQFTSSFQGNVLPIGVYTLMVQDFWGQMVILHFSVVS